MRRVVGFGVLLDQELGRPGWRASREPRRSVGAAALLAERQRGDRPSVVGDRAPVDDDGLG